MSTCLECGSSHVSKADLCDICYKQKVAKLNSYDKLIKEHKALLDSEDFSKHSKEELTSKLDEYVSKYNDVANKLGMHQRH